MKNLNKIAFLSLAFLSALGLSGCGKKGAPTIPEGTEDHYPVLYPPVSNK